MIDPRCRWLHDLSSQRLSWNLPNLPTPVFALLAEHVAIVRHCSLDPGGAEWLPIVLWVGDGRAPLSPPQRRGEVVLLKGRVEKLRVPMEPKVPTKEMMVGHAKGEMSPDMRGMPMEPLGQSMAATEGERGFPPGS
jgi:hypothetical protein